MNGLYKRLYSLSDEQYSIVEFYGRFFKSISSCLRRCKNFSDAVKLCRYGGKHHYNLGTFQGKQIAF